ncbi:MAG: AarF/ABC1/UbiB kinase family protein [Nitrospinae bacterium]|nr:AarF/ABC1/UbiB kinase family protein [Nitrospinota bacterium]
MERFVGKRAKEIVENRELSVNLSKLGVNTVLKQILVDGFFHADPHPGNILFTEEGEILFIDFGLVGRLSRSMKFYVADLLRAIAERDSEGIVQTILELTPHTPGLDKNKLEIEVMEMLSPFYGTALEDIRMSDFLGDFFLLIRDNNLEIDSNFTFMLKTLVTIESLARTLNPNINLVDEAKPFLQNLFLERFNFYGILKRLLFGNRYLLKIFQGFPGRIDTILHKLEKDLLRIEFKHVGLEALIEKGEKSVNNLTLGIIISSIIVGASLIVSMKIPPLIAGISVLGGIGFILAFILLIVLLLRILRG